MHRKSKDIVHQRDPQHRPSVRAMMAVGRMYSRMFHQLDVLTPCTLPRTGPAILVCNHTSSIDPVLIQSVCPRLIVWMMAREYYELPSLKWGFDLLEIIPVERSGKDMAATRAALRALANGRILGVFPEGRIETERVTLPFQPGVAMMAHRAGVDVYPAYLDGTQRGKIMSQAFVQPQSASLAFGNKVPVQFDGRRPDLGAAILQIQQAVEALQVVASSLQPQANMKASTTVSTNSR
ncbi:MAG: 1-acyl-sn-glycerol-3-phosphate acyltransferase [Anaerolineae bacterium]|nr:1-acyl-sn-glycerol-3-phosphate acyltransferase [Phycisphaerae bacterium]